MSGNSQTSTNDMKLSNKTKIIIALVLVAFGVLSRYLPHLPNFAPIAAIGLFAGAYLPRRMALLLPLAAMVVSDVFIGFHGLIFWTWGSFLLIGLFGSLILKKNVNVATVLASSLGASIFFFVVTNFGVWMDGILYPPTLAGLASSYINGLPFFRNTLMGDVFYATVFFGVYEFALYYGRQIKTHLAHV